MGVGRHLLRHTRHARLHAPSRAPLNSTWYQVVFPDYLGIRKALKTNQPDARGPGRSFAEVAKVATPIYISAGVVEGTGYPKYNWGVGFWVATCCEKASRRPLCVLLVT
jgi:hypothetical protein